MGTVIRFPLEERIGHKAIGAGLEPATVVILPVRVEHRAAQIVHEIEVEEPIQEPRSPTPFAIRCAMRVVSTFVLPLPAPATIISGPSVCSTACRCGSFNPFR